MDHIAEGKKYIMLSALFLGCCAWTKNEGAILAFIFLLYYANIFFSRQHVRSTIIALSIPIIIIFLLKITSHTQNDMLSKSGSQTLDFLFQQERYATVYDSFIRNVDTKFYYVKIGFYLYAILCVIEKKLPGRKMLIMLTCLITYFMIYVLTPKPLDWHLHTSQDRLMMQLMPAMIYVLANKISRIQFILPGSD